MMRAGVVGVQCPACPTIVDVPVECSIIDADRSHEGDARLVCEPDTADLWAHMWTHNPAGRGRR